MSQLDQNTTNLQNILETVNSLPSGGGVQPDWNQTDETAADFIKNKPFGDSLRELLPETEFTGQLQGGQYGANYDASAFTGAETVVIVTFDGTPYTCNVYIIQGMLIFGNQALGGLGGDTGEPFMACINSGMGILMLQDSAPHTIKMQELKTTKLDSKFVDAIDVVYWNAGDYIYSDFECTVKMSQIELMTAAQRKNLSIQAVAYGAVQAVLTPLSIDFSGSYATLTACFGESFKTIYTAEYTPST